MSTCGSEPANPVATSSSVIYYGLTKREHIAVEAMKQLMSSSPGLTEREAADLAVKQADALINRLNCV